MKIKGLLINMHYLQFMKKSTQQQVFTTITTLFRISLISFYLSHLTQFIFLLVKMMFIGENRFMII
jgi:hypothetical protein